MWFMWTQRNSLISRVTNPYVATFIRYHQINSKNNSGWLCENVVLVQQIPNSIANENE